MKTCDIMEVFIQAVTETILEKWKHEGWIGGWSSEHANFEIDGKEYVLKLKEIPAGAHWSMEDAE